LPRCPSGAVWTPLVGGRIGDTHEKGRPIAGPPLQTLSLGRVRQSAVTVSQGSPRWNARSRLWMQAIFLGNEERVKAFRETISEARFSRFLKAADGDLFHAIDLYYWNAQLCQCFYMPLQTWEVSLRNRLNSFLIWKYKHGWPHNEVCLRTLKGNEKRRLEEAKDRQRSARNSRKPATDTIVADLSAGFWVALLKQGYEFPFAWQFNASRIFPRAEKADRATYYDICDRLLDLRNRVAHHEPISHLDLPTLHRELMATIADLCPAARAYAEASCSFEKVWRLKPLKPANDLGPPPDPA